MSISRCLIFKPKFNIIYLIDIIEVIIINSKDLIEIGERICNKRRQMGYTQEKLAELMNVSIQMISNLERGNKAIRIDNLLKLCTILNESSDYILTGKTTLNNVTTLNDKIAVLNDKDKKMIDLLVDYCLNK